MKTEHDETGYAVIYSVGVMHTVPEAVIGPECVATDASVRQNTGQDLGSRHRRVKPDVLVSFRTCVKPIARRESIRPHSVAVSRGFHARTHQGSCADARRLHLAGN